MGAEPGEREVTPVLRPPLGKVEECPKGRQVLWRGVKELGTFILENRFRERHDIPPQIFKGLSHETEIKLAQ